MLLLSWLEALKTGFVRGHVRRQARRIDDASRWGTVWVARAGKCWKTGRCGRRSL